MIRPFTCLCMLVAAGAGLYLYQEKHRAEMLDRQIAQVVKATDAARERTGMLRAEWTLLNEPERLQDLAAKYLQLQPMAPTQFVQLADLDARLPAVAPPPAPAAPITPAAPAVSAVPIAQAAPPADAAAAATPRRPALATAQAETMPATAPSAPVRMASADIALPASVAAPPSRTGDARASDTHPAAARAALHQAAPPRRKPEIASAGSFAVGPSAEPRPLPARRVMAPIVDAFATPHPMQVNHPAMVQRTEAITPVYSSGMAMTGSVLGGSALGGRPMLAPPVPVAGQ